MRLVDWVARVAVKAGLTLDEALDYSPARLRLVERAADAMRAETALQENLAVMAAIGSCLGAEGARVRQILKPFVEALKGVS